MGLTEAYTYVLPSFHLPRTPPIILGEKKQPEWEAEHSKPWAQPTKVPPRSLAAVICRFWQQAAIYHEGTGSFSKYATQPLLTVNSPVTASNPTWIVCSKSEGREISGRSFSFFLLARSKALTSTYFLHSFSFKKFHNHVHSKQRFICEKQLRDYLTWPWDPS